MTKNLLIAALLSTAIGASFAQTQTPPTAPSGAMPAPAAVPAPTTAASKPAAATKHAKHAKKTTKKANKAKAPSHT